MSRRDGNQNALFPNVDLAQAMGNRNSYKFVLLAYGTSYLLKCAEGKRRVGRICEMCDSFSSEGVSGTTYRDLQFSLLCAVSEA